MRASPAFQVNLQRFAFWRSAVAVLAFMALVCTLAWSASDTSPRPVSVWLLVNFVAIVLVWAAVSASRTDALSLRWDTLNWRLGPISSVGEEPLVGRLTVVMDLGFWMLIRFVQTEPAIRHFGLRPQRCIAAQRRGMESTWHAFRCAVHASRPAELGVGAEHAKTLE